MEECSGGKVAVILNIKEYKQSAIGKGVGDERDGLRRRGGPVASITSQPVGKS